MITLPIVNAHCTGKQMLTGMIRVHITRDLKGEFCADWYETVDAEVKHITENEESMVNYVALLSSYV